MSAPDNTLMQLLQEVTKKAPDYFALISAKTDAAFESAFDHFLEKAVTCLETSRLEFRTLGEDGLSSVLVSALSVPGITATRETNSNGHVDITVIADHCTPMRKKLGEAKIYAGPAYHVKGLQQLVGRYSTGREGRGMLIVYFRKKDIAGFVKNLRQSMDDNLPLSQQGKAVDHQIRWSFLTSHLHSSGENLEVAHVGCNLYCDD
jgi:hypothetical protein